MSVNLCDIQKWVKLLKRQVGQFMHPRMCLVNLHDGPFLFSLSLPLPSSSFSHYPSLFFYMHSLRALCRSWAKICKSSSRCNITEATWFLYSGQQNFFANHYLIVPCFHLHISFLRPVKILWCGPSSQLAPRGGRSASL